MKFQGTAHRYGRDIDTDVIIPARYLNTSVPEELAKHCMEDLDAEFVSKIEFGDILVAEENFGCGSSREHAPISIKAAGISVVIAKSFARIFYRNAINTGLPIMEAPEAVDGISDGDDVEVDADAGIIINKTTGQTFRAQPFPPFIKEIIEKGGLIERVKEKVARSCVLKRLRPAHVLARTSGDPRLASIACSSAVIDTGGQRLSVLDSSRSDRTVRVLGWAIAVAILAILTGFAYVVASGILSPTRHGRWWRVGHRFSSRTSDESRESEDLGGVHRSARPTTERYSEASRAVEDAYESVPASMTVPQYEVAELELLFAQEEYDAGPRRRATDVLNSIDEAGARKRDSPGQGCQPVGDRRDGARFYGTHLGARASRQGLS